MRILHIINLMKLGGAQSLLVPLTKLQKEEGNEVTILQLVPTADRTLLDQVEANGIKVVTVSNSCSVYSPLFVFSLRKYLKECDLAHVHLFPAQYWTAISKTLFRIKTPIVTTEHSTNNRRRNKTIFKVIDKAIYSKYSYVIACADKALETFNKRYPSKRIHTISIPNGIDVGKYCNATPYNKRELLGINERLVVITMVARFAYPKRQDILVKALENLPEDCHIVFVGGSESNDQGLETVRQLANDNGFINRVHFLYARKDVPEILKSSDFIVMSSEYEGLSLSSLEGMASGVFIASDVNGLKDVVEGAGLLFKIDSPRDLAAQIVRLIEDRELYMEVRYRCLERAKQYDISIMERKYMAVYNESINNSIKRC